MATRLESHETVDPAELGRDRRMTPTRRGILANQNRVALGLGGFSIGLGLAELIVPRGVTRLVGTRNHAWLTRSYGLREIAAGIGILASRNPAPWLWARVAGDALDLATLGNVASSRRNDRAKAAFAIGSVAGVTALDVICATKLSGLGRSWARAEANLIVDRSPEECYRFWSNFENLPRFMSYIEAVRNTGGRLSHWVANGPGGSRIEWDAEIVNDIPGQRITWRSLENSGVRHSGSVDFEPAPSGRGTIVRVQLDYGHAFRALGPVARLMGKHPEQMIRKELRRFKQVMETGEVITTEGQPAGRNSGTTWLDKIAR
jgi:uncharacterized membrane protein